ncbi:stAR-related lipid transfer protein 9 isoform X2 [Bombina bombina]|uniref:stAR-related lipid transfer protein 9 isoform X2 n=1 Tax=Bombina bombina TaxID=8345 RepID=UPI00235A5365|nr:stAR-related lipid transfer protein 9 isoform X2 [Bombina bombina]
MANVRVALRVRPLSKRENAEGARIILNVEETVTRIRNVKLDHKPDGCGDTRERFLEFGFDYCYWSVDPNDPKYASQEVVFQDLGTSVLSEAIKGYNVCLFAYGQTGSGKTYTMMGTPTSIGLTPRICEGLFSCDDGFPGSPSSCRIEVSFLEIYNERVRDLLNQSDHKKPYTLRVREHPEKGPYVQGLSQHVVSDYEHVVALLEEGIQNRITAATHIHDASSRSHAIFTIQYTQAMLEDNLPSEITSKINLVDLAGSERASPNYCKDRLTEGSNINRSLVTLGIVISTLAQNSQMTSSCQSINSIASDGDSGIPSSPMGGSMNGSKRLPYIPYRDSILTWLLKDSLGGNSKTIMIATVSPASGSYNETMSTLRYASNAKNIINKPRVNEDANVKLIRDLREEINRLKNMLRNFEMRTISPSFSDEKEGNLTEIVLQNEMKIEQLTKDWTDKWTDKAAIMEQYNVDINKGKAGLTIDPSLPHLIAMDDDILSTAVVIYHLREGITNIGRSESEQDQDIVLQGEFIENRHCVISNHSGTVELRPFPGVHCTVNGQDVTEACRLSQGAVIVLGKTHRFRFNHPAEAAILRQKRSDSQASILSSGSLEWLDLSGDFSASDRNSFFVNKRNTDPVNEENQQKLRDLDVFYQRRVDEQQQYVEELKQQIKTSQVKGENELEHEQALINQLIKENQQWLVKEIQHLTAVHYPRRESAAQTENKTYAEAEVQNSDQTDTNPTPVEKDRKRLVQLELLRNCSLRRAERNIKRKKVKFQIERIVKKQKLLEAKKNLQELQAVCWISEDRLKQTSVLNSNTALKRSRSSPPGCAYTRRSSSPWFLQSFPTYSAFKKRKGVSEQPYKPRRSVSVECIPKTSYSSSRISHSNKENNNVSTILHKIKKYTSESVLETNKTDTCFGATLLINYPQIKTIGQNMDKAGSKSKGFSFTNSTDPPKKNIAKVSVNGAHRDTKPKTSKSSSLQTSSFKKSSIQGTHKGHQKNEGTKGLAERPTKNMQRLNTHGKPPLGQSSTAIKSVKPVSHLTNVQKKPTEVHAKISSSVENINRLSCDNRHVIDRRWQSTERLSRGFIKPNTEILEHCTEDNETGSSDSESFYSMDSLSSAYACVLNEQLKMEEIERNKNVTDNKGSDSEDSQISQDSLMEREHRKEKHNKKRLNKYKTIVTSHSFSNEQNASPLVKSGSISSGLAKSFSLDSLADAEDVPEADSSEEVPAEIFWKLQSPRFCMPEMDDEHMNDRTLAANNSAAGINSSFFLNLNLELFPNYDKKMEREEIHSRPHENDLQHEPKNVTSYVEASTPFSLDLGEQKSETARAIDAEQFHRQVKQQDSNEVIENNGSGSNIVSLQNENHASLETISKNENDSDNNGSPIKMTENNQPSINTEIKCHIYSDSEFNNEQKEPQLYFTENVDITLNLDNCNYTSCSSGTVTEVGSTPKCNTIFGKVESPCIKESRDRQIDTDGMQCNMCEPELLTSSDVNSLKLNASFSEKFENQNTVQNLEYQTPITVTCLSQCEAKETFSFSVNPNKQETCQYRPDVTKSTDQNENNITVEKHGYTFEDNKYAETCQTSRSSTSALSTVSEFKRLECLNNTVSMLGTHVQLHSDAGNKDNNKPNNMLALCDLTKSRPAMQPETPHLQIDINAKEECNSTNCKETCRTEIHSESITNNEMDNISDAIPGCTTGSGEINIKVSSEEEKKNTLENDETNIITLQTNSNANLKRIENNIKVSPLFIYDSNDISKSECSEINVSTLEQSVEATEINLTPVKASQLLGNQVSETTAVDTCSYPISGLIKNLNDVDGRKMEINSLFTISNTTVPNFVKHLNVKEINNESPSISETNVICILDENSNLSNCSNIFRDRFNLNNNTTEKGNNFWNSNDAKKQKSAAYLGPLSPKNVVSIKAQPQCNVRSDATKEFNNFPHETNIVYMLETPPLDSCCEQYSGRACRTCEDDLYRLDALSKERKAVISCENIHIFPTSFEQTVSTTSDQAGKAYLSKSCSLTGKGINPQNFVGTYRENKYNISDVSTDCHPVPGEISVLCYDNKNVQLSQETHYTVVGLKEKSSMDTLKDFEVEGNSIATEEYNEPKGSEPEVHLKKAVDLKHIHWGFDDRTKIVDGLRGSTLETQTYVSENVCPDSGELRVQVSNIAISKTDDTLHIQENALLNNLLQNKISQPTNNNSLERCSSNQSNSEAEQDLCSIQVCDSFNRQLNNCKVYTSVDCSKHKDSPDPFYIGVNARSSSLQENSEFINNHRTDTKCSTGLVLPYYETIFQNEMLTELVLNKEKNLPSQRTRENDFLKNIISTKGMRDDCSGTNAINDLQASFLKPVQENNTFQDSSKETIIKPESSELAEHNSIRRSGKPVCENLEFVMCPELFNENSSSVVPSASSLHSEYYSEKYGPDISCNLTYSKGKSVGKTKLSAFTCEQFDYVYSEGCQEETKNNDENQDGNLSISLTNERERISLKHTEHLLEDTVNEQAHQLFRETNALENPEFSRHEYSLQNPGSAPHISEADYSCFTSLNDNNLKISKRTEFNMLSSSCQTDCNNQLAKENQQDIINKQVVNNLDQSYKPSVSASLLATRLGYSSSCCNQIVSQIQDTQSGDTEMLNGQTVCIENPLRLQELKSKDTSSYSCLLNDPDLKCRKLDLLNNMRREDCKQNVCTFKENTNTSNCSPWSDGLHVASITGKEQQTKTRYEVSPYLDNSRDSQEKTTILFDTIDSYQMALLKGDIPNIKMTDALFCSSNKYQFTDEQNKCMLAAKENQSLDKLLISQSSEAILNPQAESQPPIHDSDFKIERGSISNQENVALTESEVIHNTCTTHTTTNNKASSCQSSIGANKLTEPSSECLSRTSNTNLCYDSKVDVKAYLKNREQLHSIHNLNQELSNPVGKASENIGENKEEMHFSSSDINPFVRSWKPEECSRVGWRQYAFNSASDVSCRFPLHLEANKLMRCSSVDEGLNSHNSPFHSHLRTYADARVMESTSDSIEGLQIGSAQNFQLEHCENSPEYYYPLSSESISFYTKDEGLPFDSTYDLDPKSENCSMQVDEIMLLYASESETCEENNMKVSLEQGTQTEVKQRRINRHQRSQTDVSSVMQIKSRNLYHRPASWSSVKDMSLHLSQLLHETSELLGSLSHHHGVDFCQGALKEIGGDTEASRRRVKDSSTQTTIDIGIQTDLQTQNRDMQNQAKEQKQFLSSPEINVILKVIGTEPLTPQAYHALTMQADGQEAIKTVTQSLPNLPDFVNSSKLDRPLCQSTVRASTPKLDSVEEVFTYEAFSPIIIKDSPVSPILNKDIKEVSDTFANMPLSSNSCNSIYYSEQQRLIGERTQTLTSHGSTIMVDRASSPILTLKASKKLPNKIIAEKPLNRQKILKFLQHRKKKGSNICEPHMDSSSQTETDTECSSTQSISKKNQKSESLNNSKVKEPISELFSEKILQRFRSENCILKEKVGIGLSRSSSTSEISGFGRPSIEYSNLGIKQYNKYDPTSAATLDAHHSKVLHPWERPHSLENLSQISDGQIFQNRISRPLSSTSSKRCKDELDFSNVTIKSNKSFFKNKNGTFSVSETSGHGLNCQDEDGASVAESDCNTEVLLNQYHSSQESQRSHNYTLQDLPLHNKFSNWSGVQGSLPRTGGLLGSAADLHLRESPTKTESSQACDSKAREIERLQKERAEIMSGIHLEISNQPLTVQLAEAKLNYGIGETDALLRVIQSGKMEEGTFIKKQLYERHMKVIESLRKEREERLQSFRRSRSLSPMKQLSSSQASLTSLRESDLPSRRREYLQQLRKNVVDNTRIQEPKRRASQCPSEIELMLKDYQKAREEAKTEIARARDKLRERAELEKKRLQQSSQPKEEIKLKTLLSTSTLCTSSLLSLSSGPTSGYNSSIAATYDTSSKLHPQETKISPRNVEAGSTRGRSAIRKSLLVPSQQSDLKTHKKAMEAMHIPSTTDSCYGTYNSLHLSSLVSYQEFARQVQASATAEVMAACSTNLMTLFNSQAASGWIHQCIEKGVSVYYKSFPSATKHGFLGVGVIKRPLEDVWCMVKDVNTRRLYDQSILTAQVHQRVGSGIQLVHIMSDMSLCYLKQPRDFCCITVESKEDKRYSLCFQSLYNESMPRPTNDIVRGEILPSAWVLQPDTINGEEITRVIYMLQVDLGAPSIPLRLLSVVTKRQPLVIASLASFLSK